MRSQIWDKDETWIREGARRVPRYLAELRENGLDVGELLRRCPISTEPPRGANGLVQRGVHWKTRDCGPPCLPS